MQYLDAFQCPVPSFCNSHITSQSSCYRILSPWVQAPSKTQPSNMPHSLHSFPLMQQHRYAVGSTWLHALRWAVPGNTSTACFNTVTASLHLLTVLSPLAIYRTPEGLALSLPHTAPLRAFAPLGTFGHILLLPQGPFGPPNPTMVHLRDTHQGYARPLSPNDQLAHPISGPST